MNKELIPILSDLILIQGAGGWTGNYFAICIEKCSVAGTIKFVGILIPVHPAAEMGADI